MVSQARSQCKAMLVNKALVLSVRRHHARVTHQIMLLVLSSAGARGAKGSNEALQMFAGKVFIKLSIFCCDEKKCFKRSIINHILGDKNSRSTN